MLKIWKLSTLKLANSIINQWHFFYKFLMYNKLLCGIILCRNIWSINKSPYLANSTYYFQTYSISEISYCQTVLYDWGSAVILYGFESSHSLLFELRVKNEHNITFDLALIAIWRAVSPFLSFAETFAFLSRRSCTISIFLILTALKSGVSPS